MSVPFKDKNLEAAKSVVNFAGSAGWIPNPPKANQPFVPDISLPNKSTKTNNNKLSA